MKSNHVSFHTTNNHGDISSGPEMTIVIGGKQDTEVSQVICFHWPTSQEREAAVTEST